MVVVAFRRTAEWGLTSPATIPTAGTSVAVFAFLVRRSLRRAGPVVAFQMFAVPTYATALVVTSLLSTGQYAQFTFVPMQLQVLRGLDAQQAGSSPLPPRAPRS